VAKYAFEQAWQNAEDSINEGALARALLTLSDFYLEPQLDEATHQKLNERLDQLAGTVIYSKRHLLEKPYKVMRGEKMEEIAARYNVSTRLLQNINGITDPALLLPGTELKVLRGPLRAEIQLARNEMTIYLGGLYAGRFSVQAGAEPTPRPGEYDVLDIQPGRPYYSSSGQMIPAGHPANPYGQWWIDLGRELSIHGSPEGSEDTSPTGCIILSSRDAADVAAILAVGSRVVIH
jgi:lipoprotein-anchoring transpeptidase ErfK/SrfK